jgi:hypothetical protein
VPHLDPPTIAALLVSALLLTWLLARRRAGAGAHPATDETLDTVLAWPPQAVRVMTLPERRAFDMLRKALPGHLVLAQVPLARFISVPTCHSYDRWLTHVGRLSVDLLVCDHSSRVIAAIDVRAIDESARSQQRHARMARVLGAAGIAVHHWRADALPSANEVRALFMPAAPEIETVTMTAGGRTILPVPDMVEVLAPGDAAALAGPQFDPVSSGFFDDLEAIAPAVPARA